MMLGSCTKLKENLNNSIYNICSDIDSYVYNPGKDYSRVCKLPAENVISYLVSQGGSSTKKDVVRYSYDPAGNLTEENYHTADDASTQKLRYAYDVYNSNVSVTGTDFTQKNHYDAEGYRDSITEQDKVTNFVYQGGMLLHELDENKNPARHYVLGNEYIGLDNNYYLTDEQGSVRYVLDAAGNVQNDYRYDAFGQRIAGQENIPNRLRYNAQIEDDLTGLYYLRARYYNTGIGRFTQEDVIYNDGLNLYAYCSSNPVMYADPSGYAKKAAKQKTCGSKANGDNTAPFDIVNYGDKTPGIENHHGVLDVWAKNNIKGYKSRASKSTTIALTKKQHDATKAVYRDWLYEKTGKKVGGKIDWTSISPKEIQTLSERMFDAAGVPNYARRNYYSKFNKYIYGLGD